MGENKPVNMTNKTKKITIYLLIISLPVIVTTLLLTLLLKTNLSHFHPVWSDEVDYWIQIQSFMEVGFKSGFFSINELTSNSSFSHYGTHGPMFPVLLGSMARLFGWQNYSGPVFNIIFLCCSLVFFLWIVKPNLKRCILLFVVLLFSYQIYLYIPTLMQEVTNFVFAILYSAFFIRLFIYKDSRPSIKIGILVLVFIASLFRVLWLFVALPIFWTILVEKRNNRKEFLTALILSFLYLLISAGIYAYWTSPFPSGFVYKLTHLQPSLILIGKTILEHLSFNIKRLFGLNMIFHKSEFVVRYLFLIAIIFLALNLKNNRKISASIIFILISTLVVTIFLYDIGNFRILAPYLLFTMLVIIFLEDKVFIRNIVVVNSVISLITIGLFLTNYKDILSNHFWTDSQVINQNDQNELSNLEYFPDADPWCNSLLSTRVYTEDLLSLKPGIGLNIALDLVNQKVQTKSHYLLVPYDFLAINGIVSTCEVIKTYDDGVILCARLNDGCY